MIGVSIVLYKTPKNVIEKTIRSVLNSTCDYSIWIVDNSPTDDLKSLKAIDKRINYVFNPNNPGYGSANNIAIKKAIKSRCDYVLVLNPDVYFKNGMVIRNQIVLNCFEVNPSWMQTYLL